MYCLISTELGSLSTSIQLGTSNLDLLYVTTMVMSFPIVTSDVKLVYPQCEYNLNTAFNVRAKNIKPSPSIHVLGPFIRSSAGYTVLQ
jgi:hypothetical protein